jgi:Holin of 3TMs, for gene-transfer release
MIPLPALLEVGGKILDRVLPNEQAKSEALAKLKQIEQEGRLAELNVDLEYYKTEQNNLTDRLKADMASDSWLSKNIRPLTLIFILAAYFIFAMMSAFDLETRGNYVELLGQWGMLIMSFYFGGRTLEKIMDMKKDK